jgi:hypothetical protein
MAEKIDEMIANGITAPFDELDPHRHKQRSEKRSQNPVTTGKGKGKKQKKVSLSHPSLPAYKVLKDTLNESGIPD